MSVIGFDIGNLNCFVAVARSGGIETIANDYSDRCTPAIVAFNDVQRLCGVSAKNQWVMNFKNTVSEVKRLIGHKYDDPVIQDEIQRLIYKLVRLENGNIGIQVQYKDETKVFTPEQILAMLLTHLKETSSASLGSKITDCVIAVPTYYTDIQRRAVLQAVSIAGLNCLKIMNETSAVALGYGLFKQDLPPPEEKARNVAFVDMGHASLQVCIVAFNKGKIKVLSSACDPNLGGRDFDYNLASHFNEEFKVKYKIDAKTKPRAWLRLLTSTEKVKKQMSSNTISLPLYIECFMDDKDVSTSIDRARFEELNQDLLARMQVPMMTALQESGLQANEIEFVEIVGGSTRIPALKNTIEAIFGKAPSTTLNQDEAVARGCAIQCAMLSHTVRVRDIEVLEALPYPINISWESHKPGVDPGVMEVFTKNHVYPFTKLLTLPHRVEPFCFNAYYRDDVPIPHLERHIGDFIVNAGSPTEANVEKVKVKVKVRVDRYGCFSVSSASMIETLPQTEEPMETTDTPPAVNGDAKTTQSEPEKMEEEATPKEDDKSKQEETQKNTEEANKDKNSEDTNKKAETKKPKKLTKSTELTVEARQPGPSDEQLGQYISLENEMQFHVRVEKERSDAKNAVEEYVYAFKDKLSDLYEKYVTDDKRAEFSDTFDEVESWLYGDGESENKQAYVDKLVELKKIGQPIEERYQAHTALPAVFEDFGKTITHYRKILDLYKNKDEKYVHIEEAEIKKVLDKVNDKFNWFNQKLNENGKCPLTGNPAVYPAQIASEKKLLQTFCDPIVNKPKPKVEPPKDTPKKEENTESKDTEGGEQPPQKCETTTENTATAENMETDTQTSTNGDSKDLGMEVD